MDVFEIEIDQMIPSLRVLRKNDGAGMVAAIQECEIAIRTLLISGPPRLIGESRFRSAFGKPAMGF